MPIKSTGFLGAFWENSKVIVVSRRAFRLLIHPFRH